MRGTQTNIAAQALLGAIALLWLPGYSKAQPQAIPPEEELLGTPFVRNFLPKEYGLSGQNWSITQDTRGLIYVGNYGKIIEYDGARFRHITVAASLVSALHTADDGSVYVGVFNDFGMLQPNATGSMEYVSLLGENSAIKEFGYVWDIVSSPDGVYFVTDKFIILKEGHKLSFIETGKSSHFKSAYRIQDRLLFADRAGALYTIKKKKVPTATLR